MPFTGAQVRAIAAQKKRETGSDEAVQRYMHNLKKKTLKHHAQWGGPKVEKAHLAREHKVQPKFGGGMVEGFGKADDDNFSYRTHQYQGPLRRGGQKVKEVTSRRSRKLKSSAGRHGSALQDLYEAPGIERYNYEPGRQRRLGGAIALSGGGGAGLAGIGLYGAGKHSWEGMSRAAKPADMAKKPKLIPSGKYRPRKAGAAGKLAFRAKPGHLGALLGGGVLIAGSRRLSREAKRNDREWW